LRIPATATSNAYAADSPINYIDPTGKINWVMALDGIGAIVVPMPSWEQPSF